MTAMTTLSDDELDTLLAKAKQPEVPQGFAERLQQKLDRAPESNVVAFPARESAAPVRRFWLSALPLAASLILGVWLGATGGLPAALSSLAPTSVADAVDQVLEIGIEDVESIVNGDVS
jgi:hypothetical protein